MKLKNTVFKDVTSRIDDILDEFEVEKKRILKLKGKEEYDTMVENYHGDWELALPDINWLFEIAKAELQAGHSEKQFIKFGLKMSDLIERFSNIAIKDLT